MTSLIEHIELTTGLNPKGTVIWMHGLGADCWDFVPLIKELGLSADLPLRFIFPQAPSRPITINNGYVMPGWYDISMNELERMPDEMGIRESQQSINALIDREISRGIQSSTIVLAGFSQGGVIALQTGLRQPHELAGILALSTYLALEDSLGSEKTAVNVHIPILMTHGTQDPIIPLALARASRDRLKAHGYQVEFHEYPMQHQICLEEIQAISLWLQKCYRSPILLA